MNHRRRSGFLLVCALLALASPRARAQSSPADGLPGRPAPRASRRSAPKWLRDELRGLPDDAVACVRRMYWKHRLFLDSHAKERREVGRLIAEFKGLRVLSRDMARGGSPGASGDRERLKRKYDVSIREINEAINAMEERPGIGAVIEDFDAPGMSPLYEDVGFQRTPPRGPAAARFVNWEAKAGLRRGDYRAAAEAATRALDRDPKDYDALALRAAARYRMGDVKGADRDALAALDMDPGNPVADSVIKLSARPGFASRAAAGAAALAASHPAGPVPRASSLSRGSPREDPAGDGVSRAQRSARYAEDAANYLRMGDFRAAVTQADRAILLNDRDVRAYDMKALGHMGLGDYREASVSAGKALKLIPGDPLSSDILSGALNRLRDYTGAAGAAAKALASDPDDADAWYNLAQARAGLGNRDAAAAALKRAAELDPRRFEVAYEAALEKPSSSDLNLLFAERESFLPEDMGVPGGAPRGRPLWPFLLTAASGLALVGLGAAHILSPVRGRVRAPAASGVPHVPDVLEGRLIAGAYRVVRQIGIGGMGRVYEGIDVRLDRLVAIKQMREEIRSDAGERERFLKEARVVASLHHPNIVEIYSIVEDGSDVYLIFEFVKGVTLSRMLLDTGVIAANRVLGYMSAAASALAFAHERGVIHRDLKPSNIMVTGEGEVKVMDFGVAREMRDVLETVSGTPPYMAPEAEKGLACRESDVYSLGVCLYELLAGRLPFQGAGAAMLADKVRMNFPRLSQVIGGLPSGLDDLIAHSLDPEPVKRPRTAEEFRSALRSIALPA